MKDQELLPFSFQLNKKKKDFILLGKIFYNFVNKQ